MEGGYGLGDPAPDISLKYWKLSSDAGHAHSIWNSGIFYFNGFGTNQDIVKGLQMIQNGMELNTDLKFPPQLSDMNQKQIDILIKLVSKSQKEDQFLDIDQLEQLIKVAKDPQVIAMNPRIFKRLVEITQKSLSENQLNAEVVVSLALKSSQSRKADLSMDTKEFSFESSLALWIGVPIVVIGFYTLAKNRRWI